MGQFSVEKPVLPGSVLSGNQHSVLESKDKQRGDIVIFDERIVFSDERPDKGHPLNSIIIIECNNLAVPSMLAIKTPVFQAAKSD